MNISVIAIVLILVIALLVFLVIKNRRDRKELIKPSATDPVEETKTDQEIRRDQL